MHAAPPVAVRCTAAWVWRALQTGLAGLAAAVFVFWSLSVWAAELAPALTAMWALLAALGAAVPAWWASAAAPQLLDWDGQRWALDGRPGEPQLMVDLGRALLLRHARRDWLVAGRREAGAGWHALRVAVHGRGGQTVEEGGLNA